MSLICRTYTPEHPLDGYRRDPVMAEQTRNSPSWHQMHYNKDVKGVWSGSGRDLKAECGQTEQIVVTSVREAVDCQKCLRSMEQLPT